MVDDPNDQQQNTPDDDRGGGGRGPNFPGGGGGLFSLLPLVLGLFRSKLGIVVIIGIALFFFFGRGGGCNLGGITNTISQFTRGGILDPNEFKKADIYEPLAEDDSKNPLPEAVSLLKFAPNRLNQGQQGSCVAWSSAYGARTIVEASSTGQDPNNIAFSPSFLYNQIGLEGCQGSYIIRAMEFMQKYGALPLNEFEYSDQDCSRQPNRQQMQNAGDFRIRSFTRLTDGDNISALNIRAIKEHLAKDAPVVIGMMVGGTFMQDMMGQDLWHPTADDKSQMGFGGHAMCVIGYDDRKEGGAFQVMNSWGNDWGNNGVAWIRYGDFKNFVKEAYGMDPMPKRGAASNTALECSIGLYDRDGKKYIPLSFKGNNVFENKTTISKGTKFKIEIKNSVECYLYLFGAETDGSSYILFPYLKEGETNSKFSPYCGITGYRLLPRGMSLMADSIGNKDYFAVLVSKQPLDYNKLNTAINQGTGSSYAAKINEALKQMNSNSARFNNTADGTMYFKADVGDDGVVGCVVEINKN
jgi:hypothetical protein